METAVATSTKVPETAGDPAAHASNLLADAVLLTHELRAALHDQLRLVSYETERTARSLTAMMAAAIAIGVLLVSAWLASMTAGALALIDRGLEPVAAALIVVALNLLAALAPYGVIRRKRRELGFPATLRTLRPESSHAAEELTP